MLVVMLLMWDGSVHTMTREFNNSTDGMECFGKARRALEARDVGFHVLSAECYKKKAL